MLTGVGVIVGVAGPLLGGATVGASDCNGVTWGADGESRGDGAALDAGAADVVAADVRAADVVAIDGDPTEGVALGRDDKPERFEV